MKKTALLCLMAIGFVLFQSCENEEILQLEQSAVTESPNIQLESYTRTKSRPLLKVLKELPENQNYSGLPRVMGKMRCSMKTVFWR
ncbi:MAG: hypothetical protein WBG90_07775 [Saonia sp.]